MIRSLYFEGFFQSWTNVKVFWQPDTKLSLILFYISPDISAFPIHPRERRFQHGTSPDFSNSKHYFRFLVLVFSEHPFSASSISLISQSPLSGHFLCRLKEPKCQDQLTFSAFNMPEFILFSCFPHMSTTAGFWRMPSNNFPSLMFITPKFLHLSKRCHSSSMTFLHSLCIACRDIAYVLSF